MAVAHGLRLAGDFKLDGAAITSAVVIHDTCPSAKKSGRGRPTLDFPVRTSGLIPVHGCMAAFAPDALTVACTVLSTPRSVVLDGCATIVWTKATRLAASGKRLI